MPTRPGSYYRVHNCVTCADAPEQTPLEYAFGTLSIPGWMQELIVSDPQFGHGWLVGVENSFDAGDTKTLETDEWEHLDLRCPTNLPDESSNPTLAWLAGMLAGRWSNDREFGTPTCRDCTVHEVYGEASV
jgi:hypothetical protein